MASSRTGSRQDLEAGDSSDDGATSVLGATLRVHRRTPIERLGTEALRFLLEVDGATAVLLRVAVERLEQDPLQAGDFYPGDLLVAALRQPLPVWLETPELRARTYAMLDDIRGPIQRLEPEDRQRVERAIGRFKARWLSAPADREAPGER